MEEIDEARDRARADCERSGVPFELPVDVVAQIVESLDELEDGADG